MANKPLIVWSRAMSVGVPLLDSQHRQLITEINRLQTAGDSFKREAIEDCLAALATYAVKHFHDEESHMRKIRYAGLAEHTRFHDEFSEQVSQFLRRLAEGPDGSELAQEIQRFLSAWLKDHIMSEDQGYARVTVV